MPGGNYDNELRGVLFKNTPAAGQELHPKAPQYKGQATIAGVEYWVSSWLETSKSGQKYLSLRFERKDANPSGAQGSGGAAQYTPPPADDDIPF